MYDDRNSDDDFKGRSLVAAFSDRASAQSAARALRDEGFHKIWIGVTHPSDSLRSEATGSTAAGTGTVVESEDDSLGAKIGRFFSGESGDRTLSDALVRHGVAETEATRLERSIPANSAILTIDGSNHPELAAQIVEQNAGHVLAGEYFGDVGTESTRRSTSTDTATRDDLRGSDVLGYGSPDTMARGEAIDQERRLRLREERLAIARQQEAVGEATIGKTVVEERQSIDVPVVREELFVERRPVAETEQVGSTAAADAADTIGDGETIRIPLMRERITVTKRPVVTEEVVVGKRQVTETQRVDETTRREELRVDDPLRTKTTGTTGTTASTGTTRPLTDR